MAPGADHLFASTARLDFVYSVNSLRFILRHGLLSTDSQFFIMYNNSVSFPLWLFHDSQFSLHQLMLFVFALFCMVVSFIAIYYPATITIFTGIVCTSPD